MSLHKEISFEVEICEHLAANGWLYEDKNAAGFVRGLALFPADVLAWVQATQPKAWEAPTKNHGAAAGDTLLSRLRQSIDQQGTLHVLRHGFDVLGLRKEIKLAQFKPALAMNPDIMSRYAANTLRVVRQVRYSLHNENSIDLVLFLNGVPVVTVELKTDFTQSIDDAVDQYRFDRNPSPKGQNPEPLLSLNRTSNCRRTAWLAHFLADLHYPSEPQGASRGFQNATTESPAASALPLTVQLNPNEKVFDTVLVISDRNVIDGQLRDAIDGFERTAGVVATIRGEGGSKSNELAEALSGDKKIVVCTIQTFPFAIKAVQEKEKAYLSAIIDALEAHTTMSTQALGSEVIRDGLRDILLRPAKLYETLRKQSI